MGLFRRKKTVNTDNTPDDVQNVYATEKRERSGVAWMLGLLTLVLTVLFTFIIFFGGRWVWQTLTGSRNDTPETLIEVETDQNGEAGRTDSDRTQNEQDQSQDANETETDGAQGEPRGIISGDSAQDGTGQSTENQDSVPRTGPSDSEEASEGVPTLPRTGPSSDD
jgi:cytoskeletal protein RodZ